METIQKNRSAVRSTDSNKKHTQKQLNAADDFITVPLELIQLGQLNYRRYFDNAALEDFAQEIALHGIISPLLLRPAGKERYEVVAGERRYRAAKIAMLKEVPATIRHLTDEEVTELQLAENLQRENPHPMHEAQAVAIMLSSGKPIEEVARRLGKTKAFVYNRLKLSELSDALQEVFLAGKFSLTEAVMIAGLAAESQADFFERYCKDWNKRDFRVHNLSHVLSSYRLDLKNAPFNIKDTALLPEAGSCVKCPFNSATLKTLFPDMAESSVCSNKICFRNKCSISLERDISKLLKNGLPDILLTGSSLSTVEEEVLGKFSELNTLTHKMVYEVDRCTPPSAPSKMNFQQEDGKGNTILDEKLYAAALEEYKINVGEFNTMLGNGTIKKAIYIRNATASLTYFQKSRSGKNGNTITAKEVQEAVKAGNVTKELLQGEIKRLQTREQRSKELDREKVQLNLHAAFVEQYGDLKNIHSITKADQAAVKWLIFESLDYRFRDQVIKALFPHLKGFGLLDTGKKYHEIAKLTEKQFVYMARMVLAGKSDSKQPHLPTGYFLYQCAVDAGMDVKSIESTQEEKAKVREKRTNERIADLKKQIKVLSKK